MNLVEVSKEMDGLVWYLPFNKLFISKYQLQMGDRIYIYIAHRNRKFY